MLVKTPVGTGIKVSQIWIRIGLLNHDFQHRRRKRKIPPYLRIQPDVELSDGDFAIPNHVILNIKNLINGYDLPIRWINCVKCILFSNYFKFSNGRFSSFHLDRRILDGTTCLPFFWEGDYLCQFFKQVFEKQVFNFFFGSKE